MRLFLLLILVFSFLTSGSFTIYEWTTSQDIPLIEALLDGSFLRNDFYTKSVLGSPRFFFVFPFVGLEKIGIPWQYSLYFFKVFLFLSFPFVIFELLVRSAEKIGFNKLVSSKAMMVFITMVLGFDLIGFFWNKGGAPIGWISITSIKTIIPMTLSSFFAGLYILKHQRNYSLIALVLSSLIHPVMGLGIFSLFQLFNISINYKNLNFKKISIQFFLGVFAPLFYLKFNYGENVLAAKDFIMHYVYIRHPHHYSILESYNFKTIFFGLCTLLPIFLYRNHKLLLKLNIVGWVLFFGALSMQLIGVELLFIKPVAIIGPSRFSTFCALILFLQYTYIVEDKFGSLTFIKVIEQKLIKVYNFFENLKLNKLNPYAVVFVVSFILSVFTYKEPIKYYKHGKLENVASWISKNISIESTFYLGHKIDSFIFRSYAKRAVYADMAFPFNEKYIQEFSKRYLIYKNTKSFGWEDYKCLRSKTEVDYLLVRNVDSKNFPKSYILYKDKKYSVYDIPKAKNCDLSKLISEYDRFKEYLKLN